MVPAPTACTDAAAPPASNLMTMSIGIEVLTAAATDQIVNSAKDVRYIDLRPKVSENEDHHRGKIAIPSIYNAIVKLVIVGEVSKSIANCGREALEIISTVHFKITRNTHE